jgi:hydroxypyruvate isomerase
MPQITLSWSVSLLFENLPLVTALGRAAHEHLNVVEIWNPYSVSVSETRSTLEALGLKVLLINTDAGDLATGEWGTGASPGRVNHFKRSFEQSVEYATSLEIPMIHAMAGNRVSGSSYSAQRECFLRNLEWALSLTKGTPLKLLLEPLNNIDRPDYFLTAMSEAAEIVAELHDKRIGIMCDIYHLQRGHGNLTEQIQTFAPLIGHYQFADVPGRHEPGTGEINYANVVRAIVGTGYDGFLGLEYRPTLPIRTTSQMLGRIIADAEPPARSPNVAS